MGKLYFQEEKATKEILSRVTSLCGECYTDIKLGDIIHYDTQQYRYICNECEETINREANEDINLCGDTLF